MAYCRPTEQKQAQNIIQGSSSDHALSGPRQAPKASKSGKSKEPFAGRQPNEAYRTREHFTADEVAGLLNTARNVGGYGLRDATAITLAYRHGLRASELCGLKREQVDRDRGELHVKRIKRGKPSTHPLAGDELRALRKHQRDASGPYVFTTERRTPLDRSGFLKIVRLAGELARLPFPVHPHMLRHDSGYHPANRGTDTRTIQDYLGHRNIQHTVRYTELAPGRFKGL